MGTWPQSADNVIKLHSKHRSDDEWLPSCLHPCLVLCADALIVAFVILGNHSGRSDISLLLMKQDFDLHYQVHVDLIIRLSFLKIPTQFVALPDQLRV